MNELKKHLLPLGLLLGVSLLFWSPVLFTSQVLLPGAMLRGFAPFGADPNAPWHILQWDALGQYYPWRLLAARELRAGLIPLWNPYQFAGTPFVANGQSAIFYPLNLPFWLLDTATAFGVSTWLHTLLAAGSTYFLAQRWRLSRAASLLAALGFGLSGYLAAWILLPTLANTASWLPLLLLLLEQTAEQGRGDGIAAQRGIAPHPVRAEQRAKCPSPRLGRGYTGDTFSKNWQSEQVALAPLSPGGERDTSRAVPREQGEGRCHATYKTAVLSAALAAALLAGHAQVFIYLVLALALRALLLPRRGRSLVILAAALAWSAALGALQVLPTLELARLGHRAGGEASLAAWTQFIQPRALQLSDLPSLVVPGWPLVGGSFSENFGYVGLGLAVLAIIGAVAAFRSSAVRLPGATFSAILAIFGLLYALATPLALIFYFGVPGLSQMGGTGRALVLWSLGAALVAAFGLDALRRRRSTPVLPAVALLLVTGELFAAGWATRPTAPRAAIYPPTALTSWLQNYTSDDDRVLFITPQRTWGQTEALQATLGIRHPPGVMPPNGATVYGLRDVNGYDSLASKAYRDYVQRHHDGPISPDANGNMLLLQNLTEPLLDALGVRYIVTVSAQERTGWKPVFRGDGAIIYGRPRSDVVRVDGRDFYPGWSADKSVYSPTSFRLGGFISLVALALLAAVWSCGSGRRRL